MVRHMSEQGFIKPRHADLLQVADEPSVLLAALRTYASPSGDWVEGKLQPAMR